MKKTKRKILKTNSFIISINVFLFLLAILIEKIKYRRKIASNQLKQTKTKSKFKI